MLPLVMILLAGWLSVQDTTAAPARTGEAQSDKKPVAAKEESEQPLEERLLRVHRIFVESFGDDLVSKQIHAMVIAGLTESKRFVVTENKDRADAILRGSGLEKSSQEFHSSSEGTAAGVAGGSHSTFSSGFGAAAAAIEDSSASTETIHDARVAVRLVDRDGDVLWATSQESKGAKYKGASADVAERVVKQLLHDLAKIEKQKKDASDEKKSPS